MKKENNIDIEAHFLALEREIEFLREIMQKMKIEYSEAEKSRLKENPKIVTRVLKYRGYGFSLSESIIKTSDDFNCTVERVRTVYNENKLNTAHIRLYARKYLVQKLDNAGFSPVQIAKIAGISKTSVYKLLKSGCVVTD